MLHQKYVEEHLSPARIAKQIGCSTVGVRSGLKKAGIPIQPPSTYVQKSRAKVIDLNERKVIQLVLEYHRLGMEVGQIADALNQMLVPTGRRPKEWNYFLVYRVLQRHRKKR
jgi:hypothetical protein